MPSTPRRSPASPSPWPNVAALFQAPSRSMKSLFVSSLAVSLYCAGRLLWWDVSHGVAVSRTMQDFSEFSQQDMLEQRIRDSWGNAYRQVTASSGDSSTSWMFSMGPDGKSITLGNDPDDITPWTGLYEWMFRMFPYGETLAVLLMACFLTTFSATALWCRRRRRQPTT